MTNEPVMREQLQGLGEFLRRLKAGAKFGALSRADLKLRRVQIEGECAECDWVARPPDAWDANLPALVGERNASTQALRDAIDIRDLLFRLVPGLQRAQLCVYREIASSDLELVIMGTVTPAEEPSWAVPSLVMRARLLGLRFWLTEGVLENLRPEVQAANF